MTDFSLLLPNIFDDNTRADKERMKRMILRLQNLQSFYYYHSEKSFVSVSFHPLSIHPCFVTKQRWAQFCVKDVKGEKRLENLWPKCPPTKPPTSHFVHVEIQRYHLLEGFETRTWVTAPHFGNVSNVLCSGISLLIVRVPYVTQHIQVEITSGRFKNEITIC